MKPHIRRNSSPDPAPEMGQSATLPLPAGTDNRLPPCNGHGIFLKKKKTGCISYPLWFRDMTCKHTLLSTVTFLYVHPLNSLNIPTMQLSSTGFCTKPDCYKHFRNRNVSYSSWCIPIPLALVYKNHSIIAYWNAWNIQSKHLRGWPNSLLSLQLFIIMEIQRHSENRQMPGLCVFVSSASVHMEGSNIRT